MSQFLYRAHLMWKAPANLVFFLPQTLYKTQVKELKEEIEERNRQIQEANKKVQDLCNER